MFNIGHSLLTTYLSNSKRAFSTNIQSTQATKKIQRSPTVPFSNLRMFFLGAATAGVAGFVVLKHAKRHAYEDQIIAQTKAIEASLKSQGYVVRGWHATEDRNKLQLTTHKKDLPYSPDPIAAGAYIKGEFGVLLPVVSRVNCKGEVEMQVGDVKTSTHGHFPDFREGLSGAVVTQEGLKNKRAVVINDYPVEWQSPETLIDRLLTPLIRSLPFSCVTHGE